MADTFTMNETPAQPEMLNSDEQDSLSVAESLEGGEQPLLAGKYKSTEELEQAYVELQKKLGEPREDSQEEEDLGEEGEEVETQEEYQSEESNPDSIDLEQAEALMEMVGGEKAYENKLSWASDNFSQDEVQMYDGVMASGDPRAIFFAVQALQSRFSESLGSDGELLTGRGAGSDDDSFQSQAELVAAMNDPRYDRDPAYRKEMMRRLENSDIEF